MKVFTLDEAATYLKISSQTLVSLAESNQVPSKKWRDIWRFGKDRLDKFLAGNYYESIRYKTGLTEKYRQPTDWGRPLHILNLKEAAQFLKVSPSVLLKDRDGQWYQKKIGKHRLFVKERIIDVMTREGSFRTPYGSDRMEFSWIRWQDCNQKREVSILTLQEAAELAGMSVNKFKEMKERFHIANDFIGKQRRFVKEYLEDRFKSLRHQMDNARSRISEIWFQIREPYHEMNSLESRFNELRRFCDNSHSRRSRLVPENVSDSSSETG